MSWFTRFGDRNIMDIDYLRIAQNESNRLYTPPVNPPRHPMTNPPRVASLKSRLNPGVTTPVRAIALIRKLMFNLHNGLKG